MSDQSKLKLLDNIKCDDTVKAALVKHDYKKPTMMQLAEHSGFNNEELKQLDILWLPAYSDGWIYLSDDIIRSQMTDDTGIYAIKNFITRSLVSNADYHDNVHYKCIKRNDPLVVAFINSDWSDLTSRNLSNNKKYYAVTGDTYEDLLMRSSSSKGRRCRLLYRKVVKLAMYMRDYISAMYQYISANDMAEQKQLLDKSKQEVNNMRIINERVQLHINNTKTLGKTSTFYIATSKRYAAQNIFKPGCIDSIGNKQLKSRLDQYNTGKTGDDLFYFCHVEEVHAAKELDYKLKKLLQQLKYNCKKEMVVVHYDSLIKIVRHVSANHTEDYEYFNTFIESGEYKLSLNTTPVIPQPVLIDTHTITITEQKNGNEIQSTTIDIANLSDAEKQQYLIQAIEIFCTNNGTEYNHDAEKNSDKKIIVVWKELQTILKDICHTAKLQPSKWRNPLKSIGDNSKSIQQIKWLNRNKAQMIVLPPSMK
jgi:hypothetical protein